MKRRPGEQAAAGEEQIPEEQLRTERAEEVRRARDNLNQGQLDRRNAIADQHDDLIDEDMADIEGDKIVERERSQAAQSEVEAGPGNQEPADPGAGESEEEEEGDSRMINGVRHYLLVVKGKEKWLTLKQLRETSSKVDSADEYLQQAADSARKAVSLRNPPQEESDDDLELEEVVNKALLGDPESVKKLVRQIKASPSRVTPDVMQAVDERLTFREAVRGFEKEYASELKDPRLKEMIIRADVRLHDENPEMGYEQRLKQAGDEVRQWRLDLLASAGRSADGSERPDKQQRKQQMTQVPGAGGRQGGTPDEDAEESVGTQIQRMAQGRHQPTAIKH